MEAYELRGSPASTRCLVRFTLTGPREGTTDLRRLLELDPEPQIPPPKFPLSELPKLLEEELAAAATACRARRGAGESEEGTAAATVVESVVAEAAAAAATTADPRLARR